MNDIDLLLGLDGRGTTATQGSSVPYRYWLRINDSIAPLARFPDGHGYVNSIKVLNKIRDSLALVPIYRRAELKRTGEAVVPDLVSYAWVFDIVPAVPIGAGAGQVDYYLIPDGSGEWKRTDPRKDQAFLTRVGSQHDDKLLPTIRLLKYWNRRTRKPVLTSFYFETLVVKVFDAAP